MEAGSRTVSSHAGSSHSKVFRHTESTETPDFCGFHLTSVGFTFVDLVVTELEPGLSALCAVTAPKSRARRRKGWQKVIFMG